jgi:hypothetical protein
VDIERAIATPHEHEGEGHNPLWLIWTIDRDRITGVPYFPHLDSVCDTETSARYHFLSAATHGGKQIWVERIPANHRFASSLDYHQTEIHQAWWKQRLKKIDGD